MAARPQRFGMNRPPVMAQFRPAAIRTNYVSQSSAMVRYPIQKRPAGSAVIPGTKKMRMESPATAAVTTAVVAPKVDAVVPSSMTASKTENAVSLLNQYRHGLNYQVVSQVGPAHAPVFTVQLEVDGQIFTGTGVNKAAARYSAAQNAVQALRPAILAELEQRAQSKAEKAEQKVKSEVEGENGAQTEQKEDSATDESGAAVKSENTPAEEQVKKPKGKNALKVLREIRPGVVVAEKFVHGVPPGTYVASTVVDGKEFEGRGTSLSLAKALAAEVAVHTLFNIQFEHSAGGFPVFVGDSSEYIRFRLENAIAVWDDDKNPVMQLNELYYESAIYQFTDDGYELPDGTVVCEYGDMRHGATVTVDGITAHGRGVTKKDAKTAAAAEAVRQLKASGLFQKRLTEKEINKAQRSSAVCQGQAATQIAPYRTMVTGGSLAVNNALTALSSENALAKLNKLHPGSTYEMTDSNTNDISNTSFTMVVTVNGQKFMGSGRSKKLARLDAAENALRTLGLWTEEDDQAKAKFRKVVLAAKKTSKEKKSQYVSTVLQSRGRGMRGFSQRGMLAGGRGQRGRGRPVQGLIGAPGLGKGSTFGSRGAGRGTGLGSSFSQGRGASAYARGSAGLGFPATRAAARAPRGRGLAGMKSQQMPSVEFSSYTDDYYGGYGGSGSQMQNIQSYMNPTGSVTGRGAMSLTRGSARGAPNVRQARAAQRPTQRGRGVTIERTQTVSYANEEYYSNDYGNYDMESASYGADNGYNTKSFAPDNFSGDNTYYSSFDNADSTASDAYYYDTSMSDVYNVPHKSERLSSGQAAYSTDVSMGFGASSVGKTQSQMRGVTPVKRGVARGGRGWAGSNNQATAQPAYANYAEESYEFSTGQGASSGTGAYSSEWGCNYISF